MRPPSMSSLTSTLPSLLRNPHALLETVIIVGIVGLATVGFMTGLKDLATDLRNFKKAKI